MVKIQYVEMGVRYPHFGVCPILVRHHRRAGAWGLQQWDSSGEDRILNLGWLSRDAPWRFRPISEYQGNWLNGKCQEAFFSSVNSFPAAADPAAAGAVAETSTTEKYSWDRLGCLVLWPSASNIYFPCSP